MARIGMGYSGLTALKFAAEKDVGALLVIENSQIVGIASEQDYARKIALRGKSSVNTPIKDIMTTKVYMSTRTILSRNALLS